MIRKIFTRPFTQQEAISQEAIDAATEVLKTGRLHRYNTIEDELSQVSLLEQEYANYQVVATVWLAHLVVMLSVLH